MGRTRFEPHHAACVELPRLLERAVPRPRSVVSSDGGAALALSAHCLMVAEGFTVIDDPASAAGPRRCKRTSIYNPPAGWNDVSPGEASDGRPRQWVFEYKYGACGHFLMYCTLHPGADKLFVHAGQAGNADNVQCCALRLSQYLHASELAECGSWDEVLLEEELLADMFMEYIVRPLVGFAALGLQCGGASPEHDLRMFQSSPGASSGSASGSRQGNASEESDSSEEEEEEDVFDEPMPMLYRRRHSGLDPKLQYMLTRTPPSLMLPAVLLTSAAATSAVLWAWRR
mmetsp:Transcript_9110/g.23303  ORF Transcript_9110/g.23303 Transcript_9110/m.23303 type:complete len:287 (+) Transcript_9110:467-1327(+)|eukprot:jgi/Tetstr1/457692/TSEL_044239.t1